jgi:hypothetical protein
MLPRCCRDVAELAAPELTRRTAGLTLAISADLIRVFAGMRPAACGRSTNAAKAAFDRNPLGGKLNGFFV